MTDKRKAWEPPKLRSEEVQETLARPACSYKPPGQGGPRRGGNQARPAGPAFS
jgi:hypothetical protein